MEFSLRVKVQETKCCKPAQRLQCSGLPPGYGLCNHDGHALHVEEAMSGDLNMAAARASREFRGHPHAMRLPSRVLKLNAKAARASS